MLELEVLLELVSREQFLIGQELSKERELAQAKELKERELAQAKKLKERALAQAKELKERELTQAKELAAREARELFAYRKANNLCVECGKKLGGFKIFKTQIYCREHRK